MDAIMTEIRVFAMFPDGPADPMHSTWSWIHCLTFPVDDLIKLGFTSKPYKWICFTTGVVIGAQGHLSLSRNSPLAQGVIEYDDDLPSVNTTLFYHINDNEKENMFPIDPAMIDPTITSVATTPERAGFHNKIVEQDGTCVLTGYGVRYCDAAHLLPHGKGDEYIETYTQHHNRDSNGRDIVCDIDDIQNGILINTTGHRFFGEKFAFLMTPNFAMTTADVDPSAPPEERRCTAHLFVPGEPQSLGDCALRSGAIVRMPDPADNWPSDILFDAIYASAVLKHFAPKTMADTLNQWEDVFYPEGITSAAQAEAAARHKAQSAKDERNKEQDEERSERASRRGNVASRAGDNRLDSFDYLMLLPYIRVPPKKQQDIWRKAAEEREERKRSRLDDKIGSWARDVASVCQ